MTTNDINTAVSTTTTSDAISPRPGYVSSLYLAARVAAWHKAVRGACENAVKRGADQRDFVPADLPAVSNRTVPGFLVTADGIEQLAEGQRMAATGTAIKVQVYDDIARELRTDELREVPTVVREDGREVIATNGAQARTNEKQTSRRKTSVGTMPKIWWQARTNAPAFEQIEAALFIGAQSGSFRRSVETLKASSDALGHSVFPVTTQRPGRHPGDLVPVTSHALTAPALDALADQFARCHNATGRNRAPALRHLAAHLREIAKEADAAEEIAIHRNTPMAVHAPLARPVQLDFLGLLSAA